MLCPNCKSELKMTERQGVEIDYCPECRGVWLDRGELDKIIDRSADYYENRPEREYNAGTRYNENDKDAERYYKDYKYDEDYSRRKKKRSFLGDFFDFD